MYDSPPGADSCALNEIGDGIWIDIRNIENHDQPCLLQDNFIPNPILYI
jgi:hypothetical protein